MTLDNASVPDAFTIQPMSKSHVEDVVRIHIDAFSDDFLPRLGAGFLRTLYEGLVEAPSTVGLVALESAKVVGFVVATLSTRKMFGWLLRRHWASLAWSVLRQTPRDPLMLLSALATLTYPRKERSGLPKAELVFLALADHARGRGLGKALVFGLNDELRPRGITAYKVTTPLTNGRADVFYRKLGFRLEHTFMMHRRHFNLYTYRIA